MLLCEPVCAYTQCSPSQSGCDTVLHSVPVCVVTQLSPTRDDLNKVLHNVPVSVVTLLPPSKVVLISSGGGISCTGGETSGWAWLAMALFILLNSSTLLLSSSSCSSSSLLLSLLSHASSCMVILFKELFRYSDLLFRSISLEKFILSASPICLDRQSLNLAEMLKSISGGLGRAGCESIQCFMMWDFAEKD